MHHSSTITKLLILFTLFYTTILASPDPQPKIHIIRQAPPPPPSTPPTSPNSPECMQYSRIANLTAIGGNNTYRSAFLQASPMGTWANQKMFDLAIKENASLTTVNLQTLSQECGDIQAIATAQAASNFTQGIVAQFTNVSKTPTAIFAGPIVLVLTCGMMTFLLFISQFIP